MKNKLGITEGKWIFNDVEMKIKGSGDIEGLVVIANVSPKMDFSRGMTTQIANAKLIADAGTTANKCNKLPSQLLQEHEEMKQALLDYLSDCCREKNTEIYKSQFKQLLTKINSNG